MEGELPWEELAARACLSSEDLELEVWLLTCVYMMYISLQPSASAAIPFHIDGENVRALNVIMTLTFVYTFIVI